MLFVVVVYLKIFFIPFLSFFFLGVSRSVMSDSLRPYGLEPARLLCPWYSPGKNTGVVSHSLLQGIFPTQGLNLISCIAGRFFIIWASREALPFLLKKFLACRTACRILVPWSEIEPEHPVLAGQSLNQWTTRRSSKSFFRYNSYNKINHFMGV